MSYSGWAEDPKPDEPSATDPPKVIRVDTSAPASVSCEGSVAEAAIGDVDPSDPASNLKAVALGGPLRASRASIVMAAPTRGLERPVETIERTAEDIALLGFLTGPGRLTKDALLANKSAAAFLTDLPPYYTALYGPNYIHADPVTLSDGRTRATNPFLRLFEGMQDGPPIDVNRGVSDRDAQTAARIERKHQRRDDLRNQLGPSSNYLTLGAIAMARAWKEMGASRNLTGSGMRRVLAPRALIVTGNISELERSFQSRRTLRGFLLELKILMVDLVKDRSIDLTKDKDLKEACHQLNLSNFATREIYLPDSAIATFKRLGRGMKSSNALVRAVEERVEKFRNARKPPTPDAGKGITEEKRRRLKSLVSLIEFYQEKDVLYENNFATTYTEARINWALICSMTNPDADPNIILGSAAREALADPEKIPELLRLSFSLYGNFNDLPSLAITQNMTRVRNPNELYGSGKDSEARQAREMLVGKVVNDARLFEAFLAMHEADLDAEIELLEMEIRAGRWGVAGNLLGLFTGGVARQMAANSRLVKGIEAGSFWSAMIQLAETGEIKAGAEKMIKERMRTMMLFPKDLPRFLKGIEIPNWDATQRINIAKNGEALSTSKEKPPEGDAEAVKTEADNKTDVFFVDVIAGEKKGKKAMTLPAAPADDAHYADVQEWVWGILKIYQDRALELKAEDDAIQRRHEMLLVPVDHVRIYKLSLKVAELRNLGTDLLARFSTCFQHAGATTPAPGPPTDGTPTPDQHQFFYNAEETLAWHIIMRAPTFGSYLVNGPPGAPNQDPPQVSALGGLVWRLALLSPVLLFGDGTPDQDARAGAAGEEDPRAKVGQQWRKIGIRLGAAGLIAATTLLGKAGLDWWLAPAHPNPEATAPAEPGKEAAKPK